MTALPLDIAPAPELEEAAAHALRAILVALRTVRLGRHGMLRRDVHERLAHALAERGIAHHRGRTVAGCRPDIWVPLPGGAGIAIQFGAPGRALYDVVRDLRHLARVPLVRALVLAHHRPLLLRQTIEGKPCRVVTLASFGAAS